MVEGPFYCNNFTQLAVEMWKNRFTLCLNAAWLNASQRSRVAIGMRTAHVCREVEGQALRAFRRTGSALQKHTVLMSFLPMLSQFR